jgi:hypothetical protein
MTKKPVLAAFIAAASLAFLTGCELEFFGFTIMPSYTDKEDGIVQIETERHDALPQLESYLNAKYGISTEEYTVLDFKPLYYDSEEKGGLRILISGNKSPKPYFLGVWQAKIRAGDREFYVNYSVSDSSFGCDTLQYDEYMADCKNWLYSEVGFPEDYELDISIDDSADEGSHRWVYIDGGSEVKGTLYDYYDKTDIFSPVEESMVITIYPPDRTSSVSGNLTEHDFAEAFPENKTGDIKIYIMTDHSDIVWLNDSARANSR